MNQIMFKRKWKGEFVNYEKLRIDFLIISLYVYGKSEVKTTIIKIMGVLQKF